MFRDLSLFIKLAVIHDRNGIELDGEETANCYLEKIKDYGFGWWNVSMLKQGMSPRKAMGLKQAIEEGQLIRLYFAVNNKNIDNDIAFSARIVDLMNSKEPIACPDTNSLPSRFEGRSAALWLKLTDMKRETGICAENYVIASTGTELKWAISHSQYKFGYIKEK